MKIGNCNYLVRRVLRGIWILTLIECVPFGAVLVWPSNADPCRIPTEMSCEIGHRYPELKILNLDMLRSDDRKLFIQDSPGQCPGVARLKFFGDPRKAVAVLLWNGDKGEGVLAIGRNQSSADWKITEVVKVGGSFPPVIWAEPPGEYADWNGSRKIKTKWPGIHLVQYESWSKLFAWDGSKIAEIQTSD